MQHWRGHGGHWVEVGQERGGTLAQRGWDTPLDNSAHCEEEDGMDVFGGDDVGSEKVLLKVAGVGWPRWVVMTEICPDGAVTAGAERAN